MSRSRPPAIALILLLLPAPGRCQDLEQLFGESVRELTQLVGASGAAAQAFLKAADLEQQGELDQAARIYESFLGGTASAASTVQSSATMVKVPARRRTATADPQ